MKYPCRIFWISVAKFSKKSQNEINAIVSPVEADRQLDDLSEVVLQDMI
jgi:hypothetical protein